MSRGLGRGTGAVVALLVGANVALADPIVVFHTGTDASGRVLPPGVPDPHYTLVAIPSGTGLSVPRPAMVAYAHPAYVPGDPVGAVPGSSWIALAGDTNAAYPPGDYVFRTTFDLTGLDPATAQIDGYYAADDEFVDVLVNGASTGISGGVFNALIGVFHINSGFHSGVNTLDFVVRNGGGSANPSGMRMFLLGNASPQSAPTDHTPPVLMGATDRSFPWTGAAVALSASSLGITAVDDVDGAVPVSLSPSAAGLGNTVVTASAHDAAGNTTTATFTVHVLDVTAPVISGPAPAQPSFDWHGAPIVLSVAQLGLSALDDVSGSVAVTVTPASVGFGDTLVTARAVDAAANVATKTFVFHVVDVTAPVISGPTPAQPTLEWHGSAVSISASLLGLSATDDVNGAVAVGVTPSTVGLGATVVTASAVDAAGNHSSRSFTVRVVDVTAPVISGPSPATPTFEWLGSPIAMSAAALGLSAADDVDGLVAVSVAPTSVGLGDTVVTASAVDAAGNAATKSFNVHVADTTAPTIVSLSATPDSLDERNHKMVVATVRASVFDAGDASPSVRIVSVASFDGGVKCGGGARSDDWTITGPLTVQLRAERSGRGNGRVYVITVQATDASGNSSTATVKVVVGHDDGRCGDRDDDRNGRNDRNDDRNRCNDRDDDRRGGSGRRDD